MSDQEEGASDAGTSKRERSPNYPYLGLSAAIELTRTLYETAKASDVRVVDIAEPWGLSPKSGSLPRYASAVAQYGLITAAGSGPKRRIRISQTGRRIIEDNRPGVREELCEEAALKPPIIRELFKGSDRITAWAHDRPIDKMAESALVFDLSFTPEAAKRFLNVYDETIQFIPKSDDEGSEHFVGPEDGSELSAHNAESSQSDVRLGDLVQWVSNGEARFSSPRRVRAITEDDQWLFVDGSQTGIPKDEVEVVGHITPTNVTEVVPPVLGEIEKSAPVSELNKINFKSEGDGVISISARLDVEGLVLLEAKLSAFKALLE